MNRGAATAGVFVSAAMALFAPTASASTVSLSLGATAEVGEPYAILAEGEADEAAALYVYVESGGDRCAATPGEEAGVSSALSIADGVAVGPGPFTESYSYTPPSQDGYSVCAYVDATPANSIVASASAGFAAPGGPDQAPYLFNPRLQEELKRIALEHEQQLERERAKQRAEQEERERVPASEDAHPEPPSTSTVSPSIPDCIVPSLKRHSLAAARLALRRAHCKLGSVVRPRHARGMLVVTWQSAPRGKKLHSGAAVGVVLGP